MPPKGAKKDDVVLGTYQRRVRNAQRKVTEANENIKRLKLNKGAKMFAEFQESWPFASFNQDESIDDRELALAYEELARLLEDLTEAKADLEKEWAEKRKEGRKSEREEEEEDTGVKREREEEGGARGGMM